MEHEQFDISVRQDPDGRSRVVVRGELDLATSPVLDRELTALRTPGNVVVLDISGVSFVDSTSVALFVRQARHAQLDGWAFVLDARVQDAVRRVFELSGIATLLPVEPG